MIERTSDHDVLEGRFVLRNRREEIERAQGNVLEMIERRGYGRSSRFAVRLAMAEALANALEHGNRNDPGKTVRLEYRIARSWVVIEIEDQGVGFDPQAVPDPTRQENLGIPCGRGIVLMRAHMTEVDFPPPDNRVCMTYVRPAGSCGPKEPNGR
ncbi:MAG: ATP-binding protein [Planctomycetes bacterium]|nr:ATP-binding protein [Planctomycetota bacterium]